MSHPCVPSPSSELLGSFGDNELSPECLYPAEALLTVGGLCIPSSYTSYLAPIHAPILRRVLDSSTVGGQECWWVLCTESRRECGAASAHGRPARHSRVRPARYRDDTAKDAPCDLSNLPLECVQCSAAAPVFQFQHPAPAGTHTAALLHQTTTLDFPPCPCGLSCDGFIGYFTARLHGGVELSTCPGVATPGLREWLPVYFPCRTEVALPVRLTVHRAGNDSAVWYEWAVEGATASCPVEHNVGGAHCTMSLQPADGAAAVEPAPTLP